MKSLIPLLCSTPFLIFASGCRSYTVYVDPDPIHEPVDVDQDGFFDHEDCDDQNPLVHPQADEVCDGIDNNCNTFIDMDDPDILIDTMNGYYVDVDGDGYGDPESWVEVCTPEAIFVDNGDDCNDLDASIHPGDVDGDGYSTCDGDCDDQDPDRSPEDADGDGYSTCNGDCSDFDSSLLPTDFDGDGYTACDGDCDDQDPLVHPNGEELWYDGIDQDCNGSDLSRFVETSRWNSCALDDEGIAVCWGANAHEQVEAPQASFLKIAMGWSHACALEEDGTIACWGYGSEDDCDIAYSCGQTEPPNNQYLEIAAGVAHTCGIKTDNSIECWGVNDRMQNQVNNIATDVPEGIFVTISSGESHACALDTQGDIHCWGSNRYNQLDAPIGTFIQLTSVRNRNCALDSIGAIHCWGGNEGTLYDTGQHSPPTDTDFVYVGVGSFHTCGLKASGTVECWGAHDGETIDFGQVRDTPTNKRFVQLSVAERHNCGIDIQGNLHCWGWDSDGQSTVDFDNDGYDILQDCDDLDASVHVCN